MTDITYSEFIENCKKIMAAGIQPVAVGLQQKDLNQWLFEYFVNWLSTSSLQTMK